MICRVYQYDAKTKTAWVLPPQIPINPERWYPADAFLHAFCNSPVEPGVDHSFVPINRKSNGDWHRLEYFQH